MIPCVNRTPAAVSRTAPLIAALATTAVALAGCGVTHNTNTPPPPVTSPQPTLGVIPSVTPIPLDTPAPPAATADLSMVNQSFQPATLYVTPGTVITLTNKMDFICGVTDEKHGLRSGDVGPGASVHFTAPDTPGDYRYNCIYEPDTMKGTLVVSTDPNAAKQRDDAAAAASSASPTPTSTSTSSSFSGESSTFTSAPSSAPSAIHTHETG
jgi:plastocyanin